MEIRAVSGTNEDVEYPERLALMVDGDCGGVEDEDDVEISIKFSSFPEKNTKNIRTIRHDGSRKIGEMRQYSTNSLLLVS
ncbi:unnamed protein product [Caenorhabditis angaria]|uniref:Uncharacterized protein n=1 Tax=Caenorhabditis angaria TaxID=860376 RepID=A0A9P1IIB6_9PELO|nr:unnamed protein product [Caenorhabditis angaria]